MMDKRFILSGAGVAAVTLATPALAQDATISMHLDYWIGEFGVSVQASDRGFSAWVDPTGGLLLTSTGGIVASSSFMIWNDMSSAYTSGYRWDLYLSNASGTYEVLITDAYGDGWVWNNTTGDDAFVASGSNVVGDLVTISFSTGFEASGEFTITPAPGALALLGLAGLAGRRKRA
jgi:hypothetical protein